MRHFHPKVMKSAMKWIEEPSVACVCFDLSQALLVEPLAEDTDLFQLLESEFRSLLQITDIPCFSEYRLEAERLAMLRRGEGVTLEDVYDELERLCGNANLDALKESEREKRIRISRTRRAGLRLWKTAMQAGKQVVVVADTVLPAEDVHTMLEHAGLVGTYRVFLSHEQHAAISSGRIFEKIEAAVGKGVYIGPADKAAEKAGWRAIRMDDPILRLKSSKLYHQIFERMSQSVSVHHAEKYIGMRCMLAMVANQVLDDPDRSIGKDFGGDFSFVGYGALGMYLMGNATWLLNEAKNEQYDSINFLARDGYFIKAAFELLNECWHVPVKSNYIRISRRAVFPLHFSCKEDFLALPGIVETKSQSPKTLIRLFSFVLPKTNGEELKVLFESNGMDYDRYFTDIDQLHRFITVFLNNLYDPTLFQQYRQNAETYFKPFLRGKCATWDVGYNLRAESVLSAMAETHLTAYITHTNSDVAGRREAYSGVRMKAMYDYTPYVSWLAREQFLTENDASCIGYGAEGEVLGVDAAREAQEPSAMDGMQADAIAFVNDMANCFGEDMPKLFFRPSNACALLEYYLHSSSAKDRNLLRRENVDNSFVGNEEMNIYGFWRLLQSDFHAALWGDGYMKQKIWHAILLFSQDRSTLWKRIQKRIPQRKK